MKYLCPFCQEIMDRSDNAIGKDRIIDETESFLIFPTIGGFVENYQLIVPKRHINCFGELDKNEWAELTMAIEWQKQINKRYLSSSTSMFEHGALLPNNESGKSIVHAHLHIFPNNQTLFSILKKYNFTILEIASIMDLAKVCHIYETYLYYSDIDGKDYIITHKDGLPSQFLRKILADSLGLTTWDWREFPYLDKIEECLKFYKTNHYILQQLRGK